MHSKTESTNKNNKIKEKRKKQRQNSNYFEKSDFIFLMKKKYIRVKFRIFSFPVISPTLAR